MIGLKVAHDCIGEDEDPLESIPAELPCWFPSRGWPIVIIVCGAGHSGSACSEGVPSAASRHYALSPLVGLSVVETWRKRTGELGGEIADAEVC